MYTLKEAREILRVCTKTIQRWDKQGKIKCIRTPGNRRLIPESEILRIIGKITPLSEEKEEIKTIKVKIGPKKETSPLEPETQAEKEKIEKPAKTEKIQQSAPPEPKIPEQPPKPKEMTRYAILDALEPSGLAIRSAFGDLLSAAILLKKFTIKDLSAKARCPETVANMFCQRMNSLGYITEKDGVFEMQIEVIK